MTRRAPLPAHLLGTAFHVGDRVANGLSAGRMRAADLQRPFTAVRSTSLDLADVGDRCRAYEPLLRPGEAFSHLTAAQLLGVPLPRGEGDRDVHVLAPRGMARARGRGVVGHESDSWVGVVPVHGLPVVEPAVAWCQLATALRLHDLVAAGDALVTGPRQGTRRAPALTSLGELAAAVEAWAPRRGIRLVREALPLVRVGAESRPESHLRLLLVEHGLPEPQLNGPVRVSDGLTLHPDLAYPEHRVLIEYLGDHHRTVQGRWQGDVRRRGLFEASGWRVVEVTSEDLYRRPAELVGRIRALLNAR